MAPTTHTFTADRGDAGRRLDLVLRRHLTQVRPASRTRLQRWIADGLVTLNGAPITRASARTVPGDVVHVAVPEPFERQPMDAEHAPLRIVYEDDDLLAVDKPAGIVVHPTYKNPARTIMNALLWHARSWPHGARPSLVGRLDKLTSGLLLIAKTPAVHRTLQQAGDAGRVQKDYLAVVHGRARGRVSIALPLARDPGDRRRVVVAATGAPSLTHVDVLARARAAAVGLSLLRCRLVTGRTHQIRVHLAASGWPIVGDPLYGAPRPAACEDERTATLLRAFPRQALHAWRLAFVHPRSHTPLCLEAPVPADLQGLIEVAQFSMPRTPLGALEWSESPV